VWAGRRRARFGGLGLGWRFGHVREDRSGAEAERALGVRERLQGVAPAAPAGDGGGEAIVAGAGERAAGLGAAAGLGVGGAEQGADDELGDEVGGVAGGVLDDRGLDLVVVHLERAEGRGGAHGGARVAQAGAEGVPVGAAQEHAVGGGADERVDLAGAGEAEQEGVEALRLEGSEAGARGQGVVAERAVDEVVAVLDGDAAIADGGLDEVEVEVTEVAAAGLRGRQPGPHVAAQGRGIGPQEAGDLGRAEAGEQLADLVEFAFAEAIDDAGGGDGGERTSHGGREIAQHDVGGEEGGVGDLRRHRLGLVERALEEAGHVGPVELTQRVAGATVLAQAHGLERVERAGRRGVAGEQRLVTRTQWFCAAAWLGLEAGLEDR